MIVSEASYELADPTINSQIVKLKSSGADLLFNASTPKFAAQAIKKVADLGWKPVHIVDINATSVGAVLVPAGLENSKGLISTNYGKDPLDPQWKDDAGMKRYMAFMEKYYPDGDKNSNFNTYGYGNAAADGGSAEALRRRPHPRQCDEAGDVAVGHRIRHRPARHEPSRPRPPIIASTSSCRCRNSTASAGSCSGRSSRTT